VRHSWTCDPYHSLHQVNKLQEMLDYAPRGCWPSYKAYPSTWSCSAKLSRATPRPSAPAVDGAQPDGRDRPPEHHACFPFGTLSDWSRPIPSSVLNAFLLPLMKRKAVKSGAGEAIPERNRVFGGETHGLASGGHAAPRRASGDDATHGIIARKSSVFRAGRHDCILTLVDYCSSPAYALPSLWGDAGVQAFSEARAAARV
jgi:hypothetical protein